MAASGFDTLAAIEPDRPAHPALSGAFGLLLGRGLRGAWRRPLPAACGLLFFVLVALLWPLAMQGSGTDGAGRAAQAAPAAWVALLLAALLASHRLFSDDADSGLLDQLRLSGDFRAGIAGLLAAHALCVAVPVVLASPLIGLLHGLDAGATLRLALSLLMGAPALCLLAGFGAALTLPARGPALLLPLLVWPWCVPVMLLGLMAAAPSLQGGIAWGALALLGALTLAAAALVPAAVAAALRSMLS